MGQLGVNDAIAAESKFVGKRQDQRSLKKEKKVREPKRVEAKAKRARSPPRQDIKYDVGQGAPAQPSQRALDEKKESKR